MKNKRIFIVILILAITTLALGYINRKSMGEGREEGNITFIAGDNSVTLTYEEIIALEGKEFRATEDTSTSGPTLRNYKGVLFLDVLNKAGYDKEAVSKYKKVLVKGLDGYIIAMSGDEINDNVFLAYEKDGKPLGTMAKGGSGPFQLIIKADTFSQRWCKYVYEVVLE